MRRWEFLALVGGAAQRRLQHDLLMLDLELPPTLLARADEVIE